MAENKKRFPFGENWARFLAVLTEDHIIEAENSLKTMFGLGDLHGMSFLDIGSGSGLFSLSARRLRARVHSFDHDQTAVACTAELRRRCFPDDPDWTLEQGSVLDTEYIESLGQFDIVYSWGVLHHTGAMWKALENALLAVRPGGKLFIAIYNDQGWISRYWSQVKKAYNTNAFLRFLMIAVHLPYLVGLRGVVRVLNARTAIGRGMSVWYDMKDWLGGYPFEVARPEQVLDFCMQRGFTVRKLKTCRGRHGCNEFVFAQESYQGPFGTQPGSSARIPE